MARDLKYTRNIRLLLTLMLVKQQLSVFFFILVSHKIGEVHDGAATMDWMAQSKKEVLQLHLQLQLVLEFSNDKVKRCQRHCRITLILLIPGTLIL
jgi:hypothetical protein